MINKINKLSKSEFIKAFANIFENAAWIAEELYKQKPFNDYEDLSSKMLDIFENTSKKNQIKILNAHPDLADNAIISSLTQDSIKEQNSVGLDRCTKKEFNEFKNLNDKYKKRFGFPFIYAVKGKSKMEILTNFRKRVLCDIDVEFVEAKKQVKKIASLRINELMKK